MVLSASPALKPRLRSVTPEATAAETVDQRVYLVERRDKQALLAHLLGGDEITKALVFTRTKHGADRVAKRLGRVHVEAVAIHGNKSQNARQRALERFRQRFPREVQPKLSPGAYDWILDRRIPLNNALLLQFRRYHGTAHLFEALHVKLGRDLRATVVALKQLEDADDGRAALQALVGPTLGK